MDMTVSAMRPFAPQTLGAVVSIIVCTCSIAVLTVLHCTVPTE